MIATSEYKENAVSASLNKPISIWFFTFRCKTIICCWNFDLIFPAVLPRGPVRATPYGSTVTTWRNRSTQRELEILGRVKLDNTLLVLDKGKFNQIAAQSRNQTLVTVMRDMWPTTVLPAPPLTEVKKLFMNYCILHNTYNDLTIKL